jgi:hypothetical protein
MPITEKLLSFIWQYKLYFAESLMTGLQPIEIISPGELNTNAGPDFFNTKIKAGNTIWAGNTEIHIKASDWNAHGHDRNPAFDNVVLHVVHTNDVPVFTSKGRKVPAIELKFDDTYLTTWQQLINNKHFAACAPHLSGVDPFKITAWIGKLGVERLEMRAAQIDSNLSRTTQNYEEAFYRQIARSFGFHINAQPFEQLANATPLLILKKHAHNLVQTEALILGQANFLADDYNTDPYYQQLRNEYHFLRSKYNLTPIDIHLWKFARLRPGNFPTLRLAQFAALIHKTASLFSVTIEATSVKQLIDIISAPVSEYWHQHYNFGKSSKEAKNTLGEASARILIINTIIPFMFVFGKAQKNSTLQDKAMQWLEDIEPETNVIINEWEKVKIVPRNAFESQALLQLKAEYCDRKRCLECSIGLNVMVKNN